MADEMYENTLFFSNNLVKTLNDKNVITKKQTAAPNISKFRESLSNINKPL